MSLGIVERAVISPKDTYLDIQHMPREIIEPPIELLPARRTISPTTTITSFAAHTPLIPCDPPPPQARWRSLVPPSASRTMIALSLA